jgi:hypothetical protein
VLRAFPSNVGVLGLLFYAAAAGGAIRAPLRTRQRSAQPGGPDPADAPPTSSDG